MLHDRVLLGVGRRVIPAPGHLLHAQSAREAQKGPSRLAFMTLDHHRVRDFAVRELPRLARPLTPDLIARKLALPHSEVVSLLDDLERHLTFLFRDRSGAVTWAYPVTVERTPHHMVFSSGETLYAA